MGNSAPENRLREANLRITKPRLALLSCLNAADRPLSAEDLHELLPKGTLDLVTIYRNMATFLESGLVLGVSLENGKQLYSLSHGHEHHHHHIICRECHVTSCMDMCFGDELEQLARQKGFTELTHTIEVYGVCKECAARKK